jgi:hypothetical protein
MTPEIFWKAEAAFIPVPAGISNRGERKAGKFFPIGQLATFS